MASSDLLAPDRMVMIVPRFQKEGQNCQIWQGVSGQKVIRRRFLLITKRSEGLLLLIGPSDDVSFAYTFNLIAIFA